ncbi:cytochrome c biogenesis CcdA family protein [Calidithermus chliarophilus]|uniref:cytochrome c biogenesis CcdA family protein n=1 Tax=Calidithermus chliarophilus TaxID=52023 RepID=UPI00040CAC78|nr:cytochrome c biogenesis protein CcdA [Calidithermus chliarophilus]
MADKPAGPFPWARAGLFTGLAAALLGLALVAVGRPHQMPTVSWLEANPLPALGLTLTAGFADGINPCAITTLLLFIGALLATVERASRLEVARRARYVWVVAGAYILGIFLLYLVLGVGFVEISSLRVFGNTHLVTRLAAFVAVMFGLLMMAEYVFPRSPIKLSMPAALHGLAHHWTRRTTVGAAFVGGVLIGTCTLPCGGGMYLAVAALIGSLSSKGYAYALLTSYNLAFVLPLLLLVGIAGSRPVLQRLSRLHITHRGRVKLGLGLFVVAVGFSALLLA